MRIARKSCLWALLIAVYFAGISALPAQANNVPPSPLNSFYGDANGDAILDASDISQIYLKWYGLPYTYDTIQPQTSTQDWNTSDVTSYNDINANGGTDILRKWTLGLRVSIPDKPWVLSNENLPLSIPVYTPIGFQINLASTNGTMRGRAGLPVIVNIDAANSTATGYLAGRTCTPVRGSRDQSALAGAQCALSVTVTDWSGPPGPTKGLTETGTYGFSVTGATAGKLRIIFSISGNPPGLDIPAISLGVVIAIGDNNYPPAFITNAPMTARQGLAYTYTPQIVNWDIGETLKCVIGVGDTCGGALLADTPGVSPHNCTMYTFSPGSGMQNCVVSIRGVDNGIPVESTTQTTTVTINRKPTWSTQPVNINITALSVYSANNGTMSDVDSPAQMLTCSTSATTCGFPITYAAGGTGPWQCGFTFTAPVGSGSCTLTLFATDNGISAATMTSNQITITKTGPNVAPVVTSNALAYADHGIVYTYNITAADVNDGQTITITTAGSDTCGGVLSGTCLMVAPLSGCTYTFTPGSGVQTCVVGIMATDNGSPFLSSTQNTTVTVSGPWTWMSGSDAINQYGVYGTKGVPDPTNVPGSRYSANSWTDVGGNLWLFGGRGYAASGGLDALNDIWRWDGANWTWVSGSNYVNQDGIYGIKGVPDPANIPGARENAVSWTDATRNFWMFGGYGRDVSVSGFDGYLNDLWVWDGANWTWISGSNARNQLGVYGTKGWPSPTNIPGARREAASWTDAAGNFWLFGGYGYPESGGVGVGYLNDLWRWDGAYWTWISGSKLKNQESSYGTKGMPGITNIPGSRSGAVLWIDTVGNIWLFGGYVYNAYTDNGYFNDLWKWDGSYWTWVGGSYMKNDWGTYGTKGVTDPANVPGARNEAVSWTDATGNLWFFGGYGYSASGSYGSLNDLWRWDGTNWTWISGSNVIKQKGVYGTKGVPTQDNVPGARRGTVSWADAAGNLWLFGGEGYPASGAGYLNDLWRYER